MAPLLPAYLIAGSDRPKVARAVRRLRARVEEEGGSEELLDAAEHPVAEVAGLAMALGLFAGPRLILVENVEAWAAGDVRQLEPYLADPTPGTTLAFVAGPSLRADHRLRKLLSGPAALVFDVPKGKELPGFVRREAERLGARLEPDAVRRLIELIGEQPHALVSELDKLATYAAGEPIDAALVDTLVVADAGTTAWAVTDALSARDRRAALRALERAYEAGQKPQSLAPQLARHLDRLRRARRAADAGQGARDFAKAAGMHEFPARKLLEAAHRYPAAEAAAGIARLAQVDYDSKGGSRLDPEFTLERAVAELW